MKLQTRTFWTLAAFVAIGFCVRLAWAHWTSAVPPFLSDPEYYNATALSIARGEGYTVVFDSERGFLPGGDPTAFWPPGYPLALGTAYALFGEGLAVARTTNVIAGALTIIPIYFIGRRLFGKGAGIAGAGIATVLPSFVFWTPVLFSETMFTLVFASALAFLLHSTRDDGGLDLRLLAVAGLLTGIAALFRGQALLLIPMAAVWAALCGTRMRPALTTLAIMSITAASVITPWTIRNIIQMDSPIVLSANFGYNLRVGHAEYSTGRFIAPPDLWTVEPGITFHEREILFNDLGRERAIEYAVEHPGEEIKLTGRKIMWLWRPDSDAINWITSFGERPLPTGAREPLRLLLDFSYLALLGGAAIGLAVSTIPRESRWFCVLSCRPMDCDARRVLRRTSVPHPAVSCHEPSSRRCDTEDRGRIEAWPPAIAPASLRDEALSESAARLQAIAACNGQAIATR